MRSGVIIAGGRSTRFGDGDKAVADLAGTPMARRVADRLAPVVDELVVNCRADQRAALTAALAGYDRPVAVAVDDDPDRGPVAGIRNGLRAAEAEYAVVVACDMPFVDPGFVATLFERAAGRDAAVPRPDEWYEPTQAVYRREPTIAACDAALAAGDPRILDPIERLDHVVVGDVPDRETFRNVNTREELAAAAADIRAREAGGGGAAAAGSSGHDANADSDAEDGADAGDGANADSDADHDAGDADPSGGDAGDPA